MRHLIKAAAGTICIAFTLAVLSPATIADAEDLTVKHPFTVEDSFNLTRLYDTQPRRDFGDATPFLFSPDNKALFMITGQGDAAARTYHFALLMFDTQELKRFARGQITKPPSARVLFKTDYDKRNRWMGLLNTGGIKNLNITDDRKTLFFIGADQDQVYQLFSLEMSNKKISKITESPVDVIEYKILADSDEIIFTTTNSEPRSNHCKLPSFSMQNLFMSAELCLPDKSSFWNTFTRLSPAPDRLNLYKIGRAPGSKAVLLASGLPISNLTGMVLDETQLSPDETWAAIRVKTDGPPDDLRKKFDQSELARLLNSSLPAGYDEATMPAVWPYNYYVLINLKSAELLHLAEIPVMPEAFPPYPPRLTPRPLWADDHRLILAEAIVLGDTQQLPRIFVNNDSKSSVGPVSIDVNSMDAISVEPTRLPLKNPANDRNSNRGRAEGIDKRCADITRSAPSTDGKPDCYIDHIDLGLRLSLNQAFDKPPVVLISELTSDRPRVLLELNPQLSRMTLAKARILTWTDEAGEEWRGGLMLPPDYDPGKRYPLVVQTHGFTEHLFWVNGAHIQTAPYAAQALANRGIVVLQVPNKPWPAGLTGNNEPQHARGVNAAIKLLDQQGIIDISRIGITGYSARGQFAFNMAVWPEYRPRAVVASDAITPSLLGYTQIYKSSPYPGMLHYEQRNCGAQPWGETQEEWLRWDPYFHLDKVHSAVLIESYSPTDNDWFDIFAGLRRLGKPVDFRVYHSGQHPPALPETVLTSQNFVVDWYNFWLNDREDPDPEKEMQYEEWRKMRNLLDSTSAPPLAATPLSKKTCAKTANSSLSN